jgi:multiple sugar transport system permease protein
LKEIPRQLYEAADIDGAGRWAKFTRITFPSLRPVLLFVSVMTIVGAFKVFGLILVLTNGGPANTTRSVIMYLYDNAFRYFRMGYASAIAWILFAVILFFTYIQFKVLKGGKAY